MGNLQQQCRGVWPLNQIVLDRSDVIYNRNSSISGRIRCRKGRQIAIVVVGTICFYKGKRKRREKCSIEFYRHEFPLNRTNDDDDDEENFQLELEGNLPPSLNEKKIYPRLFYSLNLISKRSNDEILSSIPIRICPEVTIDRPLLLMPLFFGPVENLQTEMKFEVKLNRSAFNFGDLIEIFYEFQNPREISFQRIEISLGVYYLINCQVTQKDLCRGIEIYQHDRTTDQKLIRNKAFLTVPEKIYLPPTFQFQYARENDRTSFHLTIDYKIQFRIFLQNEENLWQVDVPIVLAHKTIE